VEPVLVADDELPMTHSGDIEFIIKPHEGAVNGFLLRQKRIKEGQTWRDLPSQYLDAIKKDSTSFLRTVGAKGVGDE
jgi:hypothetical protein